ncbi:enterobactin exporter EntS [compost metagenome]
MSASRSLVQEIVPENDFIHGNSLIEISLQVGMFVAGAVSGILYKYVGFELILFLNALAFIAASFFLSRMQHTPIQLDNEEEPFFETFKNGISYLMKRPYIFLLGVVSIIPLVSTMVYNVVLPGYVSIAVGGDSIVFGLSDMFYGIGALLSGFIAASLAKRFSQNRTIILFFLISVLILVVVAFNTTILLLYVGSALIGLTNSSLRILITTTLMETVSKAYMGRSTSVWMAISLLLQTVSATGLGIVIDRYSPGVGFICMSGLMIVGLVVFSALNSRKQQQKTLEA